MNNCSDQPAVASSVRSFSRCCETSYNLLVRHQRNNIFSTRSFALSVIMINRAFFICTAGLAYQILLASAATINAGSSAIINRDHEPLYRRVVVLRARKIRPNRDR